MVSIVIDVAIVVVVLLMILYGTWRGMYKMVYGFVSSLLAVILALVLCGTVTSKIVEKTELENTLLNATTESITGVLPEEWDAGNVTLTYDDKEDTLTITHGSETFDSVGKYIEQTGGTMASLSGIIETLTSNENAIAMVKGTESTETTGEESTIQAEPTLAYLISATAVAYMLLVIVFFVLWIALYIVIRLLMFLIKKIVTHTYLGHFLNKLLGFAMGLGVAMVLVWGGLAIIELLGTAQVSWIIDVNEVLSETTVAKLLMGSNNPIYTLLVENSNMQGKIAEIVGQFSALSDGGSNDGTNVVIISIKRNLM